MLRLSPFAVVPIAALLTACSAAPDPSNTCEAAPVAVQESSAAIVEAPGHAADVSWSLAFSPENPRGRAVDDDVVGVSLSYPETWDVVRDTYLFDTHGFVLRAQGPDPSDAHGALPIARIALDYDAAPADIDALVKAKMDEYPGVPMTRSETVVAGQPAVVLGPVPGGQVSTNVYLAVDGRVYRINYYGETLDERGRALLAGLRFRAPTRSVASLDLLDARSEAALRPHVGDLTLDGGDAAPAGPSQPPPDGMLRETAHAHELERSDACDQVDSLSAGLAGEYQLSNGCWAQPTGFFIQSTHSLDANGDGWSQMGTPNFWGENTHGNWGLGYCTDTYYTNDLYAIDYFLDVGDKLFSPFAEGYVTYAGWDPENWWNYGRMVVIKSPNGKFWSLSAHMSSINVSAGQYVTDETLIGWAGSTGYADPYPHVHQAFYRYASTSLGRPYGGQGVKQTALTYLGDGGGTYTNFFKGKWVSW